MTRTRTQATLTKLAEMVANVHGELEFVEGLLAGDELGQCLAPDMRARLLARQTKLAGDRDALYATVRQFDSGIEPERIGSAEGWRLEFGRKGLGTKTLAARYFKSTQ